MIILKRYISATYNRLLNEAESLHLSALHLSLEEFGEKNVQTAKHYGNLGRLYQSMKKFVVNELYLLLKLI